MNNAAEREAREALAENIKLRKRLSELETLHDSSIAAQLEASNRAAKCLLERDAVIGELELWRQRANAQWEITRAAMEIVNAPFQIFDGRTGQRGYRISMQEFENLEKAVKQYRDAANSEQEEISNGTNANEK